MNKGSIIAELRKEKGYTQQTLAQELGVSDKAVSKWERGICLPDVSILPKLAVLLDADIDLFLKNEGKNLSENWNGFLDFKDHKIDFSERLYDKPLIYYFLSHFLLLGIRKIYVRSTKDNIQCLKNDIFKQLGFEFITEFEELPKENFLIMNEPTFVFGSDLSRLLESAINADSLIKMVPYQQKEVFLICPAMYAFMYEKNPTYLYEQAMSKNLGRGMIIVPLNDRNAIQDTADFIKIYQNQSGLLIGALEEIAYRQNIIKDEQLKALAEGTFYSKYLLSMLK